MSEMLCPNCNAALSLRKSKRATYAAPEILYCQKCDYSVLKPDEEEPRYPKASYSNSQLNDIKNVHSASPTLLPAHHKRRR